MTQRRKRTIPRRPSSSNGPSPQPDGGHFAKPVFDFPELPSDITELSDEELMVMFTKFVAWQNYAASELASAEVVEARAEANVRFVEAKGMVTNWSKDDKVTVARAEISITPPVEKARQALLLAYAHRKMTQVVYANCERNASLVSRELTRRVGREPLERRGHRWSP